jgi:hypothetical protein
MAQPPMFEAEPLPLMSGRLYIKSGQLAISHLLIKLGYVTIHHLLILRPEPTRRSRRSPCKNQKRPVLERAST